MFSGMYHFCYAFGLISALHLGGGGYLGHQLHPAYLESLLAWAPPGLCTDHEQVLHVISAPDLVAYKSLGACKMHCVASFSNQQQAHLWH